MSECNHRCAECTKACTHALQKAPMNRASRVKHVIGVVSGKGGVGKSLVTCLLAVAFAKKGYRTAILDADITGASVPHAFGLSGLKVEGDEDGMIPVETKGGIKLISANLLVEEASRPVLLRGAAISAMVKQFWTDVHWGEVDYMFVDMPPGTGDVPLTVYQSLPLDGIVMVGTPQGLVAMIVKKALAMAKKMNVRLLGLVENMSYVSCPDCDKRIYIYGKGKTEEIAKEAGCSVITQLPIDASLSEAVDNGSLERFDMNFMDSAVEYIRETII